MIGDLEGLTVAHGLESLIEGHESILVLKDQSVLADEDDELMDVQLAERERTNRNLQTLAKVKSAASYNPYDENDGTSSALLSKYDEEIHGVVERVRFNQFSTSHSQKFTLSSKNMGATTYGQNDDPEDPTRGNFVSLESSRHQLISDYQIATPASFKKKKKRVKSTHQRKHLDETLDTSADNDVTMAAVSSLPAPKPNFLDGNFVDDEELNSALAKSRQLKIRKRSAREFALQGSPQTTRPLISANQLSRVTNWKSFSIILNHPLTLPIKSRCQTRPNLYATSPCHQENKMRRLACFIR